jgi:SAM-dependent methyltransferase
MHEFFSNISRVLKPGGVFIGTVPNGDKILNMLGNSDELSNEQVLIKKMFDTPSTCGDAIQFSMTGTLYFGENMISHEYLVYENVLRDIAGKNGLVLVEWKSFEEHYKEQDILLHEDTQKASFVNNTFIFKRVQGESLH